MDTWHQKVPLSTDSSSIISIRPVAWLRNGYYARLTIKRSWVLIPFRSLSVGYYLDGWLFANR